MNQHGSRPPCSERSAPTSMGGGGLPDKDTSMSSTHDHLRFFAALTSLDELLVDDTITPEVAVARAAIALGAAVGLDTADRTVVARPDGTTAAGDDDETGSPAAGYRELGDGWRIWISPAQGYDSVIPDSWSADLSVWHMPSPIDTALARIAATVTIAGLRAGTRTLASDIRAVVDGDLSDEDRMGPIGRLRIAASRSVAVMAFLGPAPDVDRIVHQVRAISDSVHHTRLDRVHLVLATDFDAFGQITVPTGVRGGYMPSRPALAAPDSWRRAKNALRFALPSTADAPPRPAASVFVDATELGCYELLAEELTPEGMARIADVQRLEELRTQSSPDILETLLAVASTDSLRQAARIVHLHHNSVAHRVERAERVLGFSCTEPYGRARLLLTLTVHRLFASRSLF